MPLTDPSELFQARIDALNKMRGELDEEGQALADAAVSETVKAEHAFVSLSEFAVRVSRQLQEDQKRSSPKLQESLEQLRRLQLNTAMVLANPEATEQQKTEVVGFLNAATESTENLARAEGATQLLKVETFVTVTTLSVETLSQQILRPNQHEFNAKTVETLIDFALAVVAARKHEFAIWAALVKAILKLVVFNRSHSADSRITYLQNYTRSIRAWTHSVQKISRMF